MHLLYLRKKTVVTSRNKNRNTINQYCFILDDKSFQINSTVHIQRILKLDIIMDWFAVEENLTITCYKHRTWMSEFSVRKFRKAGKRRTVALKSYLKYHK